MTVPLIQALILVPVDAAISSPVCVELLTLLDSPNLDVIVPLTGLQLISTPFTVPKTGFVFISFSASTSAFAISSTAKTASSVPTVKMSSSVKICLTPTFTSALSLLYSSFTLFTTSSASSAVFTYVLISSSNVIP